MPVWIGILMLMGIVTKNAIMLVEFAIESIRAGQRRDEAMIDAGMKRARPIVMTTIAMVAGMMPSALAFGAGGEFRSPMALAVIGGLMFSTVLSLVFVPAMFMVMDDLGALIWRFGKKLIVSSEDADHDDHHRPARVASRRRSGRQPSRLRRFRTQFVASKCRRRICLSTVSARTAVSASRQATTMNTAVQLPVICLR